MDVDCRSSWSLASANTVIELNERKYEMTSSEKEVPHGRHL